MLASSAPPGQSGEAFIREARGMHGKDVNTLFRMRERQSQISLIVRVAVGPPVACCLTLAPCEACIVVSMYVDGL